MLKKFCLLVVFLLLFFKLDTAKAFCDWELDPLTGKKVWWKCVDEVASCDNLPKGKTCGAGVGCYDLNFGGSTGCYDCATAGTCNGFGNTPSGNTCPQGQVWDSCKTGTKVVVLRF